MLFRPELIAKILDGSKTQTRRPYRDPAPTVTSRRGRTVVSRPFEPKAGRTYAVQSGRGKKATLRIDVTDVRRELAGDITDPDARLEGFKTADDFKAYWVALYDRPWLERAAQPATPADVLARFEQRHACTPVWVITFTPARAAAPDYLAARSEELYTTDEQRALRAPDGSPEEAIDEQQLEAYARTAHDRHEAFLRALAAEQPLEQRIASLRQNADQRGIDITRQMRSIEKRVEATERKVRRAA